MDKRQIRKVLAFWVAFLVLHYAYEFFPILPFKLFSGVNESFFQHAKVAFFSYLGVNLGEYWLRRNEIERLVSFLYSRLFSTMVLPWFVFIAWFSAAAYYGPLPAVWLEIIFANIALLASAYCVLLAEEAMESVDYGRAFKAVILALFIVSFSYYIIFTFRLPWTDFFSDPYATGN
jgi:hypothetical protein